MPQHENLDVTSVAIRAEVAAIEQIIPGLHDAVGRTALAAYANPEDGDARRDADQALASLRDASDRLAQLTAAASLAEQNEAAEAKGVADAKLLATYRRKERERDAATEAAEKATERQYDEQKILDAEQGCLDWYAIQWDTQNAAVEKLKTRVSDFTWAADERWDRLAVIEAELAALPRSTAEAEAREQARRVAEQAALAEAERAAEEDTARRLAEMHDNEMVEVDPPVRIPSGSFISGTFDGGMLVAVAREDLAPRRSGHCRGRGRS